MRRLRQRLLLLPHLYSLLSRLLQSLLRLLLELWRLLPSRGTLSRLPLRTGAACPRRARPCHPECKSVTHDAQRVCEISTSLDERVESEAMEVVDCSPSLANGAAGNEDAVFQG